MRVGSQRFTRTGDLVAVSGLRSTAAMSPISSRVPLYVHSTFSRLFYARFWVTSHQRGVLGCIVRGMHRRNTNDTLRSKKLPSTASHERSNSAVAEATSRTTLILERADAATRVKLNDSKADCKYIRFRSAHSSALTYHVDEMFASLTVLRAHHLAGLVGFE